MAITASNSEIIKSARRIKTNPSVVSVKALKFNKKQDYSKFIKWIDSSTKELEKIKLPKKKDIKGITVKGRGGIGLLGLAAILGVGGLIASGKLTGMLNKSFPNKGKDGDEKKGPPGSGTIQNVAKGVAVGSGLKLLSKTPMGKNAVKNVKTAATSNRWLNRFFNPMNKAKNKIVPFNRAASTTARKVTTKGIGKGIIKNLPVIRTVLGVGSAAYRASQGDFVGAGLSLGSAIPLYGWGFVAADIARDFMPKGGTVEVKRETNIGFSNSIRKFENVVGKFETMNFAAQVADEVKNKGKKWWNPFTWFGNKNNKETEQEKTTDIKESIKKYGFDDAKFNMELQNDGTYKVTPKENKVSNINFNKNQVIVMVPQGMQPPSGGGGIVPIPIPTGGGGNSNIIMNNSSDDVNTIASNLLLTKLSV